MSNEEISMEYDYIAEEEECPATPPSIPTITDAVVVDPFAQAIMLELESAAEPDSRQRTHRPQLSSAISGYETAKQNLTPIINREQRRRHHEQAKSFISSSSSNNGFDRGAVPKTQIISLESSPENTAFDHSWEGTDSNNSFEIENENEKMTQLDTSPTRYDTGEKFQNRQRTATEEIYDHIKEDSDNNTSGMKFYESDVDDSGSVVYNGRNFRRTSRDSKDLFPSMSSIGTMGSDSDLYHALPLPSYANVVQHFTPQQSGLQKQDSGVTPQIANLSKQKGKPIANGSGHSASSAANVNESMSTTNAAVLPYQARKQQQSEMNSYDHGYGNYENQNAKGLSTINAPMIPTVSSPKKGLPPSGIQKNRNPKHFKSNGQQHFQSNEEEFSRPIPKPPSLHLRIESGGSVSSLGSTMDGATSMAQQQFSRVFGRLEGDMQNYHNDNNEGSEHHPRRDRNGVPTGNDSRGYISAFLDNLTLNSGGSFRSVEDERADYQKKSQKILKKTAKIKQKANSSNKSWFPEALGGGGERKSIRSLSPAAQPRRSHRPKLPSIDNDTWDEDEEDESRKKSKNRREVAMRKKSSKSSRPPIRQKKSSANYGSVNASKSQRRFDSRKKQPGRDHGRGSRMSKRKQVYECPSDQSESSEDESCISSDFTSNQFSVDNGGDNLSVYSVDNGGDNSSVYSDENESPSDGDLSFDEEDNHERTSLLPSGISTDELGYPPRSKRNVSGRPPAGDDRSRRSHRIRDSRQSKAPRQKERDPRYKRDPRYDRSPRSHKSRHVESGRSYRSRDPYYDENSNSSSPEYQSECARDDFYEDRKRMERRIRKQMLKELEEQRCCNRFSRRIKSIAKGIASAVGRFCSDAETFIGNLPLTIGAVGLAIVTLGVAWFKFAEEMLDSCRPVHFHSSQCTFYEFPGCFYCDTSVRAYKMALAFHQICSAFAGVISLLFVMKICIARKVVVDEMNSPTTSSPAGLICMTIVCVAAGRGIVGQMVVTVAAAVHFCVAVWFIVMAGSFNILPDPSWYPNTVGIGISAVKTWLYYPMVGHFLMLLSLSFFSFFFPISLVRVTLNKKISAPVSWIQMSAPAVSLYAMTIMAQPSFEEEHPDINEYQRIHRMVYLPCMHLLFVAAVVGALSSAQSLYVRWDSFKKIQFSPAHAAFCFPTLAHANSIQAYRGAIDSFSSIPQRSTLKILLNSYWMFVLVGGTIATLIITVKFFQMLPSWTSVNLDGENEPPAPHETIMSNIVKFGDGWAHNFVSPVVLQANEAGALVQVRKDGRTKYVRTRRVTALGFEPIMDLLDFTNERAALLDWVEKNPPRTRNRTMSVPGFSVGNFGSNNRGIYTGTGGGQLPTHVAPGDGRNVSTPATERRRRAQTLL